MTLLVYFFNFQCNLLSTFENLRDSFDTMMDSKQTLENVLAA